MAKVILYEGDNTLDIQLNGLNKTSDASLIADATVTCTINDSAGDPIAGVSWPVSMPFVSGGDYAGVINHASDIVAGTTYDVDILVIQGANRAEFSERVVAKKRPFTGT